MDEAVSSSKTSKRVAGRRKSGYLSGAHTTHRLRYHLVFVPKYRHRVLVGALKTRLEELFARCCEMHGWVLLELNVQADHVHMLVQLPPSISVSFAVKYLKGGSSRILRTEFPDLDEYIWKSGFWSDGFFAESVGVREEEMIRRYIRDQDSKKSKVTKLK
jgi:putative transposase